MAQAQDLGLKKYLKLYHHLDLVYLLYFLLLSQLHFQIQSNLRGNQKNMREED